MPTLDEQYNEYLMDMAAENKERLEAEFPVPENDPHFYRFTDEERRMMYIEEQRLRDLADDDWSRMFR
jgi:hypothetical protein